MKRTGLAVAALLLAATVTPSRADTPQPTMTADSVVVADENFSWTLNYELANPLDLGFFADSLFMDYEDTTPGARRAPRRTTQDLHALLPTIQALSGGAKAPLQLALPALFEEGRLHFRLYGHTSSGPIPEITLDVLAKPGELSKLFVSEHATVGSERVEFVRVPLADPTRSAPGVMLVASEDGHARDLLRFATALRQRGIASVLVSLPGCGSSTGAPDFAGPATLRTLEAGWKALLSTPGVDPARLAAAGTSQGGTAVALWAATRKDVRAVALVGAYYDLWASARASQGRPLSAEIVAQAGRDSASWRKRSPVFDAQKLHGAILVVHGSDDAAAPVATAQEFAARAGKGDAKVQVRVLEKRTHELGPMPLNAYVLPFLKSQLVTPAAAAPNQN